MEKGVKKGMKKQQRLRACFDYLFPEVHYKYLLNRIPYYTAPDSAIVYTLDMIRERYGVDHIIVGHTMLKDVTTFLDGKVIDVNVDNRVNQRKHRGRGILIEGDRYYVVGDQGKKRELKQAAL